MITDVAASKISGNVSDDVKKIVCSLDDHSISRRFGVSILRRMKVTEVSVLTKAEEPEKLESRVVCELDVKEGERFQCLLCFPSSNGVVDMINGLGSIHGGCSALLIDVSVLLPSAFRRLLMNTLFIAARLWLCWY